MPGEGGKLVRRGDERQAGEGGKFGSNGFGKTVRSVKPGADGRASLGQFTHGRQGAADRPLGVIQLRDIG
ncbi:hypothetical protein D3C78_1077730 [compost metagenome]